MVFKCKENCCPQQIKIYFKILHNHHNNLRANLLADQLPNIKLVTANHRQICRRFFSDFACKRCQNSCIFKRNRMAAMKKSFPIVLLLVIVFSTACNTLYNPQSLEYADYRVKQQPITDSSIIKLLSPYSTSLNASMNEVIATVAATLEKKQPEGTLGNLMADIMLAAAKKNFAQPVDVAVMNYGGIRLTEIAPGPFTRGKLFELSPFDNTLVLLTMKGSVLKQFLDHTASFGGWPVAGMRMQISNKKATQITINGKQLDENAQYTVTTADYVANGGDDSFMLKGLPRQDRGLLIRDALQAYFTQLQKEGRSITSTTDGRITSN